MRLHVHTIIRHVVSPRTTCKNQAQSGVSFGSLKGNWSKCNGLLGQYLRALSARLSLSLTYELHNTEVANWRQRSKHSQASKAGYNVEYFLQIRRSNSFADEKRFTSWFSSWLNSTKYNPQLSGWVKKLLPSDEKSLYRNFDMQAPVVEEEHDHELSR